MINGQARFDELHQKNSLLDHFNCYITIFIRGIKNADEDCELVVETSQHSNLLLFIAKFQNISYFIH